jgi:hypothetical protein
MKGRSTMNRYTLAALVVASSVLHAQQQPAPSPGMEWRQCVVEAAPPPPVVAPTFVPAGGNLQAALDAAAPGTVLELEAGATFTGNFTLPVKSGTAPITVRTRLTLPEARIDPAANLATLRTPNSSPALRTLGPAAHWRLDGLRFAAGASSQDIVALGDGLIADAAQLPRDLVLDRVVIEADTSAKNGLVLNCADTTLRRSVIRGVKLAGVESHAIVGYNGPGPFTIDDNTLEAGSIGVLFGGAAPAIPNLTPSDILVQHNLVTRPIALHTVTGYAVKNLLELKNAQRVTIRGNVFQNNWPDGQAGYAIVFTVRANSANAPWSTVQHVLFEHNVVRHTANAFNVLGLDDAAPSTPMDDVVIRNNLIYDLDRVAWAKPNGELGGGVFMLIGGAPRNLHVERNTALGAVSGNILNLGGPPIPGFVFRGNVAQKLTTPYQTYGVFGNGVGEGNPAFATFCPHVAGFPDLVFVDNVLAGASPNAYSAQPGNLFPPVAALMADFLDPTAGNYRLVAASAFLGKGCDMDALEAAQR